jgi:peptide/nickel transport system ATP-binding protein
LPGIPGTPPDPRALPPGCRFAPRCAFAVDACAHASPALEPVDPGHRSACLRADAVRTAA